VSVGGHQDWCPESPLRVYEPELTITISYASELWLFARVSQTGAKPFCYRFIPQDHPILHKLLHFHPYALPNSPEPLPQSSSDSSPLRLDTTRGHLFLLKPHTPTPQHRTTTTTMRPLGPPFSAHNIPPHDPSPPLHPASTPFTLSSPPHTDLFRSPTSSSASCPLLLTRLRFPFTSAEVTLSAPWALEWDQAGLVIFVGDPPGAAAPLGPDGLPQYETGRWFRAGGGMARDRLEFGSTYGVGGGADWVLSGLEGAMGRRADLRVKMERLGTGLWVYYEGEDGRWCKVREVNGFFCGVDDKRVWVGVYAARPGGLSRGGEGCGRLTVEFMDLSVY